MYRLSCDTPETYRALVSDVLEVLQANRCLKSHSFEGADMQLEWEEGGFERAFTEFKAHPYSPFNGKNAPGQAGSYFAFLTVLRHDDKAAVVDEYLGAVVEHAYCRDRPAPGARLQGTLA
jgi:hypothetical protein